ncbi:phosphotransferase family protein [Haladaptatus sp. DJG-WS-42]|uniref:phosphotransferase family protein n=1 Tax=Haladaptatus sp. DJG-WS-42 TaxID=3120516 RepID=UPI0030D3B503
MSDHSEEYFSRIVDEEKLAEFLEAELGAVTEYDVRHHKEGHSNETLFVTWGDLELVIRRPPPGETAESAHDVLREYKVMNALQDTPVRVPRTILGTDDHSVLGCDFYVMEKEAGDVLRRDEPERFAHPEPREQVGEQLVDALAEIHETDYEAVGLGEFGYPEGYTERQVSRWKKQFDWASEVTEKDRTVSGVEEVYDWLVENTPESHDHTLVHGDYKLDNVMFGPGTPPEIVGVFDWELSTLGDPLCDLGWMLAYWRDDGDEPPAVPDLMARFMEREGYPSRQALVDRYEEQTGREFVHERFYRTLAVFKLIGLGEMFYRRYLEGNSDDDLYPQMETQVQQLTDRAKRIIDGKESL